MSLNLSIADSRKPLIIPRVKEPQSLEHGVSLFMAQVKIEESVLKHRIRCKFRHIEQRCRNDKHVFYKYYGARGISVFAKWLSDYKSFYDYVSCLPHYGEERMTLDRINNDGNYEPGNLRWVNMHIQTANRGLQNRNKVGYTGVQRHRDKYRWDLTFNGKKKRVGGFLTPEDAVRSRNEYITNNNLTEYPVQIIS